MIPQALEVSSLTVHYDESPVLWDINLSVPCGKMVGIVGPNGAGKSTLMKTLLGLIKPVSGTYKLLGQPPQKALGKIAYIPQRESIDWTFPITVEELVLMGRFSQRGLFSWMRKEDIAAAHHSLELVGMQGFHKRQIDELSGGQKQRAFLARALLQDADLYFLDEPFTGVDHASEEIIIHLLKKMQDDGKTIFMIHHDLNSVDAYFDWLIVLNVRLIASGPKSQVFTSRTMQEAYGRSFMLYNEALGQAKI